MSDSPFQPKKKKQDFKEMQKRFGAFLQAQRQLRRMTIEEISQHIRVPPAKLRALEAGEFNKLPKMPFILGIVQSFGKYIGCDVDGLLLKMKEFEPSIQANMDLESVGKPHDERLVDVEKPTFYLTRKFVLMLVLLTGVIVTVWYVLDYFTPQISSVFNQLQAPTEEKETTTTTEVKQKVVKPKVKETKKQETKNSSDVVVPPSHLEVHSKWPNYIKLKRSKTQGYKTDDVLGSYVGPNQPFKVKAFKGKEAQFWSLYPEAVDVFVNRKKVNVQWKGQLARINLHKSNIEQPSR